MSRASFLLASGACALLAAACANPVHDAEVAALGPDPSGMQPGPTHRAGQPCLVCHGGQGPGGETFVTAGTIYESQYTAGTSSYAPVVGGTVHLIDANGLAFNAKTNTVGNFFVTTDQWNPTFPLGERSGDGGFPATGCFAATSDAGAYPGEINVTGPPDGGCQGITTPMSTSIDRPGAYASCAYCHYDPPGPSSPGHVYLQ